MRPFTNMNNFLVQSAAGVFALLSPISPRSPPTSTLRENAATDADSNTPLPPSQQQLSAPSEEEPADTNADTTPTTPLNPKERGGRLKTDADSETTVVGEDVETASEKKRRKRREKDARQRDRRSGEGPGPAPPASPANPADPSPAPDPAASPAAPPAVNGVQAEGVSSRERAVAGSEDIPGVEGGQRVDSRDVEGDTEAGGDQIEIVEGDGGKRVARVVVRELGDEEDGDEDSQDRGDAAHSEPRLIDPTASKNGTEHDDPLPYPGPQRVNLIGIVEPEHDRRAPPFSTEPRLVSLPSIEYTERLERVPILPEPQPVEATRNSEPERDPARPPLVNLTTSIFESVRTEEDPRCSRRRLAILRTRRPPPFRTVPTIKQLYPKHGLGPTIEIPSKASHPLFIDSLDSPNTTPKQKVRPKNSVPYSQSPS